MAVKDVTVDGTANGNIDLGKLTGSRVARVEGYVSREFGDMTFKLSAIVLENGARLFCEGEHDFPYVSGKDVGGLNQETMQALYIEENGEE